MNETFLAQCAEYLRLPSDEASSLATFATAAFEYIDAFTGLSFEDVSDAPASIQMAAMMLVADYFENREAQSAVQLYENKTVDRLLWPFRTFGIEDAA